MNIQINIECESITEFHAHLLKLSEQITIYLYEQDKKEDGVDGIDKFPADLSNELDDDNCYGSHKVKILKLD